MFASCIGDDIIDDRVPEVLRFTNPIDSLKVNDTYQFEVKYFNEIGEEEGADLVFTSSDDQVVSITSAGLAEGISPGTAKIIVTTGTSVSAEIQIIVSEDEVIGMGSGRPGTIATSSSYLLEGNFTLEELGEDLVLTLEDNFMATSRLPGLYVYLGNNRNSISNALEISMIQQFSGKHTYTIKGAGLYEYEFLLFWCKPFGVKVGVGTFDN